MIALTIVDRLAIMVALLGFSAAFGAGVMLAAFRFRTTFDRHGAPVVEPTIIRIISADGDTTVEHDVAMSMIANATDVFWVELGPDVVLAITIDDDAVTFPTIVRPQRATELHLVTNIHADNVIDLTDFVRNNRPGPAA